jgi:hypothetical protein
MQNKNKTKTYILLRLLCLKFMQILYQIHLPASQKTGLYHYKLQHNVV